MTVQKTGWPTLSPLPPVRRFGVLPEILFRCFRTFGCEVLANNAEHCVIRADFVAHRPIAPIDDAIYAENVPKLVERGPVERGFLDQAVIFPAQNTRNLGVD